MGMERITSADVARLAGVSQSAVSRVFTPGASASEEMILKVREAAQKLGYRPNIVARSLITGRTRMVGLVVAYLENQFYPEALERLSLALQKQGYHVLIFMASNQEAGVDAVIQQLLDYQVDGIIAASVSMSNPLTTRCDTAGIPVVLFNRGQEDRRLNEVTSDNVLGGQRVAEFLVAGGHQRIAHIAGWQGASTGRDRAEGFLQGLRLAGREPVAVIDGLYKQEAAVRAAAELFDSAEPPDALFVGNDHMAFAVMDYLRYERGLSIPEQVSIIGYDDVPLAAWAPYQLTTVQQPLEQMVSTTVETLLGRIDGTTQAPQKVRLEGPLVVRRSARIPQEDHARL